MKKRILVLTPRYPYPVIGGDRLRIFQICKALSSHYSLTLLSLCETPQELDMPMPEDGVFSRIERIYLPKWRSWLNCLLALPSSRPLQVAYYNHAGFRRKVQELMPSHDATIAHLIRTADYIRNTPGIKFLEMTDAISLNYDRVRHSKGVSKDWRTVVYKMEVDRLRKFEENIVDKFDLSFLVSDIDRQYLFSNRADRLALVQVVSNGVDLESFPFKFTPGGRDIVFIGAMTTLQNFDAALYMASEVLPIILEQQPDVVLRLIGRITPEKAEELSAFPGVRVSGEVPVVSLAAQGGAVGVCPLRLGAGVQNKVLEYMALGLPTVTTSLGLEGFEAKPDFHLFVADDARNFAQKVLYLISNREDAEKMALRARSYVENCHSWRSMLTPALLSIDRRITEFE